MRLVIKEEEKLRVKHATVQILVVTLDVITRYNWSQYYKDTVKMVRRNKLLLYVTLTQCIEISCDS